MRLVIFMITKIIQDKKFLSSPCKPNKVTEDGLKIGQYLLEILAQTKNGVGLAANQIGMDKAVCVIAVGEPIILVNPKIVGKFGKFSFMEASLSFPGEYIKTERYSNIAVKADNFTEILYFDSKKNALECVCVQHEIDHLNGITMHDRKKGENSGKN